MSIRLIKWLLHPEPREHPYEFYEKLGYKIVGVLQMQVVGTNRDIWMAKRLFLDQILNNKRGGEISVLT